MSIDDATTAANDRLADRDDMIVCVNVDKFYGDFQALKGVTATIKEGEVAVVCGPSGSGKAPGFVVSTGWKSIKVVTLS